MMERRYLKRLVEWNESVNRKPLIVWGARQVGKTYLIKDIFAERYFPGKYIYIDCREESEFCRYCETHTKASEIIEYLSLDKGITIDSSILLIFDEVQECPSIITLMKYMCQNHREIPVIVTGSMVRIRIKRKNRGPQQNEFLFPVGKIDEMTIYPMSFGEYLYNRNKMMYDKVVECYRSRIPMESAFHSMAMDYFYEFLLIGGMPESVSVYLDTGSLNESRKVLKALYGNYLADMELYQASPESIIRTRAIFSNICTFLNRESENFSPSIVEKGAKNRDMRSPIDWLREAHVIYISNKVEGHVTFPLMGSNGTFRIYLADMGMFSYQSGINPTRFITGDGRDTLSGVFYENYAATELGSKGIPLFHWCGKGDSEFEFILEDDGFAIPVDVKKKKGPLNSLGKFRDNNRFKYAVKVSRNNYGFDETTGILTIPFYQLFLFAEDMADDRIPESLFNER